MKLRALSPYSRELVLTCINALTLRFCVRQIFEFLPMYRKKLQITTYRQEEIKAPLFCPDPEVLATIENNTPKKLRSNHIIKVKKSQSGENVQNNASPFPMISNKLYLWFSISRNCQMV